MHNRYLVVTADMTTACNRGCTHCAFRSDMNEPAHLEVETVARLISQINNLDYGEQQVNLCFTGGGEPLFNPHLPDIVRLYFDKLGGKISWIKIVTSGLVSESEKEKAQIEKILGMDGAGSVHFCLSFHAFSDKATRRLTDTLSLLIEKGRTALISINLYSSRENFRETYRMLYDCLAEAEKRTDSSIQHLLVETWGYEFGWQGYTQRAWSMKTFHQLSANSFGIPCHLLIKGKNNEIRLVINPFSIANKGRAKSLNQKTWGGGGCPYIFAFRPYRDEIHLSVDGSLFPSCDCMAAEHLRLNAIGSDLRKIIKLRRILSRDLFRWLLLSGIDISPGKLCEACRKVVWQNALK